MKSFVFSTTNTGKLKECQSLLPADHWQVFPLSNFSVPEVAETGLTFIENALIKARHTCIHTGLPALADDSGLVVTALNGEPGIFSARYAGDGCDSSDNNNKLLQKMAHLPLSQREAHFYCALVYLRHAEDPEPLVCSGQWQGQIATELSGTGGFGYDPLFYLPELVCTAAELSMEEKNKLSHRGQALRQFAQKLQNEH